MNIRNIKSGLIKKVSKESFDKLDPSLKAKYQIVPDSEVTKNASKKEVKNGK